MGFNNNDNLIVAPSAVNIMLVTVKEIIFKEMIIERIFLRKMDIKDYDLIYGRNFYDQNINDDFKKYEELRKEMNGMGEDYATGSLIDYGYWEKS